MIKEEMEEMEKMEKKGMIGKNFGRIFLVGLLIIAAAVMAACGTTVNIRPTDGSLLKEESLKMSFTSVAIEVKTEVEDSQKEVKTFKDFLEKEFKARNIIVADSGTDARITVVIKHLKGISGATRFLAWPFASFTNTELKTEVVIATAKNNLSFLVDISAGSGVSGLTGTINDVLKETAKKIVEKIL